MSAWVIITKSRLFQIDYGTDCMSKNHTSGNFPNITVLTVSWNQKKYTVDCLRSLQNMNYPNYNILLVDNGSTDDTVNSVRDAFPDVEIYENNQNLGFAGGFNVGLRLALTRDSAYIFMVNNDTIVAPDILDTMMEYMNEPNVGIVSPMIYELDDPTRIWSVGAMKHPITYEMTLKGDGIEDKGQFREVMERDYLVGCALFINRKLLQDIGLFDEGYNPAYYEDMDLCLRARQAGYRLLLVPQAKLWHKGSVASGGSGSPQERYLMARNSVRFFRKHIHGWRWLFVIPYRFGSAVKTAMRLIHQKNLQSALYYLKGLKDGIFMPIEVRDTQWTS